MNVLVGRLVVAVLLFAGWIGYLGYQVATRPHTPAGRPLVLSHSQVLVSDLDVVASVPDTKGAITIEQVLYPPEKAGLVGQTVRVTNLDQCAPFQHAGEKGLPGAWTGPGRYLLPLRQPAADQEAYEVMPTPPTIGYPTPGAGPFGPPRIYPATEQALAQYHAIPKPH